MDIPNVLDDSCYERIVIVIYDPDKIGAFHKAVTLYCNAKQSPLRITISGRVE